MIYIGYTVQGRDLKPDPLSEDTATLKVSTPPPEDTTSIQAPILRYEYIIPRLHFYLSIYLCHIGLNFD